MNDVDQAEHVNLAGDDGSTLLKSSFSSKLLLSIFLSASMDEIWSILNSLQVT